MIHKGRLIHQRIDHHKNAIQVAVQAVAVTAAPAIIVVVTAAAGAATGAAAAAAPVVVAAKAPSLPSGS